MPKYIMEDKEISSGKADKEDFDEKNSNQENHIKMFFRKMFEHCQIKRSHKTYYLGNRNSDDSDKFDETIL